MTMVATQNLKAGMIVEVSRYRDRVVILRDATKHDDGTVSYRSRNPGASDMAALLTISGNPEKEFKLVGWSKRVRAA